MHTFRLMMLGVLAVSAVTFAEPSTQPAKKQQRLVQPWSKVTDLTEEQREQIVAIHSEITDKINALRDEEQERCRAILTEEQKAALDATLSREAADRKAKAAEKKAGKPDGN